jgi:hypothetical protein
MFTGCASRSADLKPSDVNVNPLPYDRANIRIRGWALFESGVGQIWDSEESYKSGDLMACTSLLGVDRTAVAQFNRRQIEVSGRFYLDAFKGVVNLDICNLTGLKVSDLAVHR